MILWGLYEHNRSVDTFAVGDPGLDNSEISLWFWQCFDRHAAAGFAARPSFRNTQVALVGLIIGFGPAGLPDVLLIGVF